MLSQSSHQLRGSRHLWLGMAALTLLVTVTAGVGVQPPLLAQAPSDPTVVGQWSALINFKSPAIHAHMLRGGSVLYWPSGSNPPVRRWNPNTSAVSDTTPAGYSVFCSGHTFLPDGRLLVAGGSEAGEPSGDGLPFASVFNPSGSTWTRLPDMNAGRWYPSCSTLANGDILVISGNDENGVNNKIPQVWQTGAGTWRTLTGAQLQISNYPWTSLAPDERIYVAGPSKTTRFLNTAGTGSWTTGPSRQFGSRGAGSFAMYEPGKVLAVGGGDPPTNTAEVINLNAATPAWSYVAPMSIARRQINATILADGKVLVTGGSSKGGFDDATGAVLYGEIWTPSTNTWARTAGYAKYRGYHSTALLLPDGRVLSAGGNGMPNAEVYSPPYLFKGARPTISSAPASVSYGQTFLVGTPNAANVESITWIRLGSVTHSVNQSQRLNYLSFTAATGGLNVTAPANANLAPPGHYLLFLVNSNGVPSVARIVRLG